MHVSEFCVFFLKNFCITLKKSPFICRSQELYILNLGGVSSKMLNRLDLRTVYDSVHDKFKVSYNSVYLDVQADGHGWGLLRLLIPFLTTFNSRSK